MEADHYDVFAVSCSTDTESSPFNAYYERPTMIDLAGDVASRLVQELTTLAHEEPARPRGPVRLDEVLAQVVDRLRRRADGHVLQVDARPWFVPDGDRTALERPSSTSSTTR